MVSLRDSHLRHATYYETVLRSGQELYLLGGDDIRRSLDLIDSDWSNIQTGQAWVQAYASESEAEAKLCSAYALNNHVLELRLHPHERIRWQEAALASARLLNLRQQEFSHISDLGLSYAEIGQLRRAVELYNEALLIAREIGERRSELKLLNRLGNTYTLLGDARQAIELFQQSLAISREVNDRRGEGTSVGNLGYAYFRLGETSLALEYFEQHLAITREIGDLRGEGQALGNLGIAYADIGEINRAIEFHEQNLRIARDLGDRRGEGSTLANLGSAYASIGETGRAIEAYESALAIARSIDDRHGESVALSNLGNSYVDLGDTDRAIELYEEALSISREIGDRQGEAGGLHDLAVVYSKTGQVQEALECFEQSLVISRQVRDIRTEARALIQLGIVYTNLKDIESAMSYYQQALNIAKHSQDLLKAAEILLSLGNLAKERGEFKQANQFLAESESIYLRLRSPFAATVTSMLTENERISEFHDIWSQIKGASSKEVFVQKSSDLLKILCKAFSVEEPTSARLQKDIKGHSFIVFSLPSSHILGSVVREFELPIAFFHQIDGNVGIFEMSLQALMLKPSPFVKIGLLVLFHEDFYKQHELIASLKKFSQVHAYDVVVLDRKSLERILAAPTPLERLRSTVLNQVKLSPISPFTTTGPVRNEVFFGREGILREVVQNALTTSYSFIGGRRIGKSSLLYRLHQSSLPDAGFITLYHDCSVTSTYERFLAAKAKSWRPHPPEAAPLTFGELFQAFPGDKPLALLLDEADKLVPNDQNSGWPLFNTLRSFINSGGGQLILSGEQTLRRATRDPESPLFNFANEVILGPLDFRSVEELITVPMKKLEIQLKDEAALVQRIYKFTSGHPNVIQRLCRRLLDRLDGPGLRSITMDDVESVINDRVFQEEDFLNTYWHAASPLEKLITLVLSQKPGASRLREIRKLVSEQACIAPSAEAIKEALEHLVDLRSILKRTNSGYEFAVEAFPLVLTNTSSFEDLMEVEIDNFKVMAQ